MVAKLLMHYVMQYMLVLSYNSTLADNVTKKFFKQEKKVNVLEIVVSAVFYFFLLVMEGWTWCKKHCI